MAAPGPDKTPVIAGIGEITDRPEDLRKAREPVELMAEALLAADADAGVSLLESINYLGVVGLLSWPYRDPARQVCDRLGIDPARAVNESFGGETPTRLIHEAAVRIAKGEPEVAAVVGGEAISSLRKSRKAGIDVAWTPRPPREERFKFEFMYLELSESSNTAGVKIPADIYPLFENAYAGAKGQTPAQAIDTAAELWAEYARVASTNPYAWNQSGMSADEIAAVSDDNRRVAFPYTKYMVANSSVNQAAAIIVTSLARARELGVADDKLIYLHGGAYAAEPGDYLLRDDYRHVPAQEAVLEAGVKLAGGAKNIDALELYSCFPVVPRMAQETLGALGASTDLPPTVAGGLTFFGGPLNNYMAHATCAMVRKLRNGEARLGMLYGQGGVSTKHHTMLLSDTPSDKPLELDYSVQEAADAKRGPIPERLDHYTGPATVETYTIKYGTAGEPQFGVVVTRTPEGARVLARVRCEDESSMALLSSTENSPIGSDGHIRVDGLGGMVWEEGALRDRRV